MTKSIEETLKDSSFFKPDENFIEGMKIHLKKKKISRKLKNMKSKRKRKKYYKQLNMLY